MIPTQVPARGQTNVKVIEKSSPTAPEKMHHVNITSERYFPASKTTIKEKSS